MVFPGPMDGLMLMRTLRLDPRTARLKIVVLTGRVYDTDRDAARRVGCDVFLAMPCSPDTLLEALGGECPPPPTPRELIPALMWSRRGEVAARRPRRRLTPSGAPRNDGAPFRPICAEAVRSISVSTAALVRSRTGARKADDERHERRLENTTMSPTFESTCPGSVIAASPF